MVLTVVECHLDILHRKTCNNTTLHGLLHTGIDCGYILSRDNSTFDSINKFVSFSFLKRLNSNIDQTKLTFTTGLANKLTLKINFLSDRLAVSNLRLTDIRLNLKLTPKPVNQNLKMEFTHTGNQSLTGFIISLNFKSRVLFGKLRKRHTELIVIGFCFRFNRNLNNRLRKNHFFENNRIIFFTECITCPYILQTYRSCNVTAIDKIYILALIGVHLKNSTNTLFLASHGIQDITACLENT